MFLRETVGTSGFFAGLEGEQAKSSSARPDDPVTLIDINKTHTDVGAGTLSTANIHTHTHTHPTPHRT